jgi:hypothetical protein
VVAPAFYVAGYILREVAAFYYDQIGWYIATTITILVSP